MSHMVEEMMYVGARPWHGLGKKLDNPPTIKEGIIQAGLDWKVFLNDLYLENAEDPIGTHYAVTRNSDQAVLGVVGSKYRTLQNMDAFNWFDPFLEEGLVKLESAGSLDGGRKVWILAKINGEVAIKGEDTIEKYILLSNSHDGSSSISAGYTPIRVVCNNTLTAAIGPGAKQLRVRHTQGAKMTLEAIRDTMNVVNQTFEATVEQYQFLARKTVSKQQVEDMVKIVFKVKNEKPSSRSINQLDKVMWLWENGTGNYMDGVRGTAWAAYNAVTEYLSKEAGSNLDNRYKSLWFGGNATRNAFALDQALKIAA